MTMTPRSDRTLAAAAARRRIGDNTAAARLRKHGWLVVAPEKLAGLPADIVDQLTECDAGRQ